MFLYRCGGVISPLLNLGANKMNARDIIKLAAQLYVYDALKKKITILTNIQTGRYVKWQESKNTTR